MRSGLNISLTIWDEGDDAYDHTELAANWDAVDGHDHSPGKGKPIPTAGIADDSVTNAKLAPNSVTTVEILNGTILAEDIADGQIGVDQLDPLIFNRLSPLGSVIAWFRPTNTVPVPTNWRIADGSVINALDHDWTGAGNVTIPDLRNKFILGAGGSGPAENATGGSHNVSLNHSHTVSGHSHTVNAHSHTVNAHTHTVNDHAHGISSDGGHKHVWNGNDLQQRPYQISDGSPSVRQAAYIPGFNEGDASHALAMNTQGAHSHTGSTGGSTPGTSASSPGTSDSSPATDSVGLTTNSATISADLRPAFVGLLFIVKVKNG